MQPRNLFSTRADAGDSSIFSTLFSVSASHSLSLSVPADICILPQRAIPSHPNPIQSHPHASYMHMTNRFWFHVFPPISFRVLFGISFFFSVTPVSHRQCSQPSIVTVATVIILHPFNCSDSVMMLSYHCQYI